jgi:hypothetical protein
MSGLGQIEKSGRSTGKSALPPNSGHGLAPRKLTLCVKPGNHRSFDHFVGKKQ